MGQERPVDLRSDTVTVPTPAMLEAMSSAEVGDDVYGEDPTANRLQAVTAELLGKQAALFVPSGTMANLVCLSAHTAPGDEVILDRDSHCCRYEAGGYAAVAGLSLHFVPSERGIIQPEVIPGAIRPDNPHFPRSRLVVIENTHNRGGGAVYPLRTVEQIGQVCRRRGLALHMDGARLFNACVASGADPDQYARHVDSVFIALSKGLGCPVGSVVAGTGDLISRARRLRKRFGGGMRQIGYLAAAGLYALRHNIPRLARDHENAALLADGIRDCEGLGLKYDPPETNMVYFRPLAPHTPGEVLQGLNREGIRVGHVGDGLFRAVTHIGITAEHIERVVAALREHFG